MVETGRKKARKTEDIGGEYGNAVVLSNHFVGRYRWADHRGRWMLWTGQVWKEVPNEVIIKESSEVLRQHYVKLLASAVDKDEIKALGKRVYESTIYNKVEKALNFFKGWVGVMTKVEEWDAEMYEINVMNGVLHLKTGGVRPHDPKDLFTKLAPVEYDPEAGGEMWEKHLDLFLPDLSVRREVRRSLGISLVGGQLEERLDIWYGVGANGKTTTARVLLRIFGDYAKRGAPGLLVQTKSDHHPTEIADLRGSRLVFTTEIGRGKRLAEVVVKDLTGGDRKKARYMRQDFFEFDQTFSIMAITNDKPEIRGMDDAIWRRIKLVPWEKQISKEDRRPQDEVVKELVGEGSAILNWVLDGLKDWWNEPYWISPEVKVATEKYRGEMDILAEFLTERCEFGPRYRVTVKELYTSYEGWCGENGIDPLKRAVFGKLLSARGIEKHRTGKMRSYKGVKIGSEMTAGDGLPIDAHTGARIENYTERPSPIVTPVVFANPNFNSEERIEKVKGEIEGLLNIAKYAEKVNYTTIDSVACELEDLFDGDDETAESWFKKACENKWLPFIVSMNGRVVRK